eukprot:1889989-Prymnesium_polylepis.1
MFLYSETFLHKSLESVGSVIRDRTNNAKFRQQQPEIIRISNHAPVDVCTHDTDDEISCAPRTGVRRTLWRVSFALRLDPAALDHGDCRIFHARTQRAWRDAEHRLELRVREGQLL